MAVPVITHLRYPFRVGLDLRLMLQLGGLGDELRLPAIPVSGSVRRSCVLQQLGGE